MPCIKFCNSQPALPCNGNILATLLVPLLAAVALLVCHPATGWSEMISGKVLALDKEEHLIMLEVQNADGESSEVVIQTDAPLPPCAVPGETMRAWGSYEDDTGQTFIAHDLRGPGRRFTTDPTGVRSRLHKYHRSGGSTSSRVGRSRHSATRRPRRSH